MSDPEIKGAGRPSEREEKHDNVTLASAFIKHYLAN